MFFFQYYFTNNPVSSPLKMLCLMRLQCLYHNDLYIASQVGLGPMNCVDRFILQHFNDIKMPDSKYTRFFVN